jgi:hypothetical protein
VTCQAFINSYDTSCVSNSPVTALLLLLLLLYQSTVVLLEEPEHLNWYRCSGRWSSEYQHVVGVLHTDYSGYAADLPGWLINKAAVGLVCRVVCRLHCHKVCVGSLELRMFCLCVVGSLRKACGTSGSSSSCDEWLSVAGVVSCVAAIWMPAQQVLALHLLVSGRVSLVPAGDTAVGAGQALGKEYHMQRSWGVCKVFGSWSQGVCPAQLARAEAASRPAAAAAL